MSIVVRPLTVMASRAAIDGARVLHHIARNLWTDESNILNQHNISAARQCSTCCDVERVTRDDGEGISRCWASGSGRRCR